MITQPNPFLIFSNLNGSQFLAKALRSKAIVNMIGFLLLSLEIEGWMGFFALFLLVLLVIDTVYVLLG
jgi:hypothetical protein